MNPALLKTSNSSLKKRLLLFVFGFVLGLAPSTFAKDPLIILDINTEEYPPFNMTKDNQLIGVSTEIIKELMKRNHLQHRLTLLPWARAMALTKELPNNCVYSISRTPEREHLYQWIGPLVTNEWVLFATKEAHKRPKSLAAIRGSSIGTYIGDAIETYLKNENYTVEASKTDEINIKKLQKGHIDYWATGKLIGLYLLKENNIQNIEPVLTFNKTEMYLACNLKTSDSLVATLNKDLASKQMQRFRKKVFSAYNYKPN